MNSTDNMLSVDSRSDEHHTSAQGVESSDYHLNHDYAVNQASVKILWDEFRRDPTAANDNLETARTSELDTPTPTSNQALANLLPQHSKLLVESAISPEVAAARGYRSITKKADLETKGFSYRQRNVPGLLVPIYSAAGELATYQFRPDQPRINKDGKAIKYETPYRSRLVIDVPPMARPKLGDPMTPLFISEGSRKADAAVSIGLCCIALLGVWGFRATNEHGGKVALPDWEYIALNGREVYIVFDSDVMSKREVYAALLRLKAFLEGRHA